jgi:CBS-domain-containing membrane protein
MTREVVCVRRDLRADMLAEIFLERGLHGAPVLNDERALIGFVSLTDLLRCQKESLGADPAATAKGLTASTVGELMTPFAISVDESAPITLAAALMSFEGLHRIPVVGGDGEVVGVLSALDVLRWLAVADGYLMPETVRRRDEA